MNSSPTTPTGTRPAKRRVAEHRYSAFISQTAATAMLKTESGLTWLEAEQAVKTLPVKVIGKRSKVSSKHVQELISDACIPPQEVAIDITPLKPRIKAQIKANAIISNLQNTVRNKARRANQF